MLDPEQLKRDLLASGKLSAARLAEAEAAAKADRVSLSEALVSRLMISFPDLGASCARVTGLPYVPLVARRSLGADVGGIISPEFAQRLGVCPIGYDPQAHTLTLAVQDLAQVTAVERLLRFLMQDANLEFTVAPDVEIARANERLRPGGESSRRAGFSALAQALRRSAPAGPIFTTSAAADSDNPTTENGRVPPSAPAAPNRGGKRQPQTGIPEPAYSAMSQALTGAAMLLVRTHHAEAPERLHGFRTRVRYCQLMAARLKLTNVQADALVIAAWLSALGRSEGVIGQLTTPYKLEEVIYATEQRGARSINPRLEGRILSLVVCFQDLKAAKPELCRDVNMARRELFLRWPFSQDNQAMLETFLQILVDEEFLEKLGRSTGRVLIVDPEELALCSLAPPLISMGYDVIAMPDTNSARGILDEFKPDLILVSVESPPDRALWFCERLKGDARTAGVPILAVVDASDPQLPIKCLRAGANDFLSKPVHPELLFLKVQNHLAAVGVETKECGVSGSLEEMSFTDMIQILSAGRRSVDLYINSDTDEGRVYIRDGDVVHATLGKESGENAFYALMQWKRGTFTTRQCDPISERTIHVSTMSLLMEGARQADEKPEADA